MTPTCMCKETSCTNECTEQHTHSKFFCEKYEPVVTNYCDSMTPEERANEPKSTVTYASSGEVVLAISPQNTPHNCEQNIESNMTPAHCSVCDKSLVTPGTEMDTRIIDGVQYVHGERVAQLLSSRDTYWKEELRKRILSHKYPIGMQNPIEVVDVEDIIRETQ